MTKKRKTHAAASAETDASPKAQPAPGIATAIGPLLERAGLNKLLAAEPRPRSLPSPGPKPPSMVPEPLPRPRPKAPATPTPGDQSALNAAYRGVQPIARPKRGRIVSAARVPKGPAPQDPEEQAARERLSALVSGGVRFEVRWDDGLVEGLQRGASETLLRRLTRPAFTPEITLDLHGMRREQAARAVHELIRTQHRRGVRRLLIIVGKGLHSEGGLGVLADALVDALTQGVAAPLVAAFATADARHGGRGAIAVQLV